MKKMSDRIIIYGAGNVGREAYWQLCSAHQILFFVDRNESLWGSKMFGKEIRSPQAIAQIPNVSIIVASTEYETEMVENLYKLFIGRDRIFHIFEWRQGREAVIRGLLTELNESRSIDLGAFLLGEEKIEFPEMDMTPGGGRHFSIMRFSTPLPGSARSKIIWKSAPIQALPLILWLTSVTNATA